MDSWEDGFDTWTPPAAKPGDAAAETDADLDRAELLRLARELAQRHESGRTAADAELEQLKHALRERAEAVAARERELEKRRRELESSGRPTVLRPKRRESFDREALVARERAALERAAALEAEAERVALRERELAEALAAAKARLEESEAERRLAAAERERLEERDRAVHEVEKQLAAARVELDTRLEALDAPAAAGIGEPALERLQAKLAAREHELALMRQGIDAERNALHERERALRRREAADARRSFAPPLAPPSFSEGLAAFARSRRHS